VHAPPKSFTDDPNCRHAWIAGASVRDTPDSPAGFAVVLQERAGKTVENHGRSPNAYAWYGPSGGGQNQSFTSKRHGRVATAYEHRKKPLLIEPYPGTVFAAEWIALYWLAYIASGGDHDPLVIHTTRKEIADVLDGRVAISANVWLARLQTCAPMNRRVRERGGRRYFTVEPSPGAEVFVHVIPQRDNRRAARLAKEALLLPDRELVHLEPLLWALHRPREMFGDTRT
jgi:hypothetical protein